VRTTTSTVTAEHRIALVIGNAHYKETPLEPAPLNDAHTMADTLRELGFAVTLVLDANYQRMANAVEDFSRQLHPGSVGVFYFAGHGATVDGQNYLIPVHAMTTSPSSHLQQEAMDAQRIVQRMEESQTTLNIVIFDAYWNPPYFWGENTRGRTRYFGARGLAPFGLAPFLDVHKSFIAYGLQSSNAAADGVGPYKTYTQYLLQYIKQPGLSLPDLFDKVDEAVRRETHGMQQPRMSRTRAVSSLPPFCFAGCAPLTSPDTSLSGSTSLPPDSGDASGRIIMETWEKRPYSESIQK
jgi:uncharacterized caspase-like protein